MAVVGSAEIIVRAITNKVKDDIAKAFKDASPAVKSAGEQAGKDWAAGFGNTAGANLDKTLKDMFSSGGVAASVRGAGEDAGKQFSMGAAGGIGKDQSVARAAETSFGDAGRKGGSALERALRSGFADAAVSASRAFTTAFAAGNIFGVAIAGLVSSLSAVVSGLFAMASAAAVAGGSLVALPGLMFVAAQAAITLKLAFAGVGAALKAGLAEAAAPAAAAAGASVAQANAIRDAQKQLSRARFDAAIAAQQAAQRVISANQAVAQSEQHLLDLQRDLRQARKEGAETLQQLAFSAEEAALAERRAGLTLEEAYAKLQEVQSLPPDDATRRDAELAFEEAELAYREAKDRNADLQKQQEKAAKAGVEGTDEVLSVQEQIADAKKQIADDEAALAEAREAQNLQEIQSQRQIADAVEAVRRAKAAAAAATRADTQAVSAYQTALDKLSPAAQTFVKYLISIKDRFDGLKQAAGEELFPKLQTAIANLLSSGVLAVLEEQLRETGSLLGDAALGVSDFLSSGEGQNALGQILEGNNEILRVFTKRGEDGSNTISTLLEVATRLAQAIQPVTKRFAEWIDKLVQGADAATAGKDSMQKMTDFFEKAGNRARLLGDIFGNLFGIIGDLGKAADPAGKGLLQSFQRATRELDEFLDKPKNQKALREYFEDVADNLRTIGDTFVQIGDQFLKLGDNKGISDFMEAIQPAIENFGTIGDNLTSAGGSLGEFITNLSEILVVLADTGGIEIFFDVLNGALKPIVAFAKSDFGGKFLLWAGGIAAFARGISFVIQVGKKVAGVLLGGPISAMRRLFGQSKKTAGGLGLIKGASDKTITAFERQMTTDGLKVKALKKVQVQADLTAGALTRVKTAGAPGKGAQAAAVGAAGPAGRRGLPAGAGDQIGKNAALAASTAATPMATAATNTSKLGKAASLAMKPVGLLTKGLGALSLAVFGVSLPVLAIVAAIGLVIFFLVKLYKHSPAFKAFIDGLVEKVKELGEWIGKMFVEKIFPALDKFFVWIGENLPKVGDFFKKLWEKIGDGIQWVKDFVNGAKEKFSAFKENVANIIANVKGKWDSFKQKLDDIGEAIGGKIAEWKQKWENFKENIRETVEKVKGFFGDLKDKVVQVVDDAKAKWEEFKTKLGDLKTDIETKIGDIKKKFGEIGSAITNAFSNLGANARTGINAFIRFLNEKLIANINKITSKFGLTIGNIPEIQGNAQGGRIRGQGGPTQDNQLRRLSVGEQVIRTKSARKIGYTELAYMNQKGEIPPWMRKGSDGTGGWGPLPDIDLGDLKDLAGDAVGGIKNLGETIAKEGLGKVLEALIKGATGLMGNAGISRGSFINDLFYGIMDKLAEAAKNWAGNEGKTASGTLATPGGAGAPYDGPPGGWTYPLAARYPITQYANAGHSPPWAIDIGAPDGTPVRAASAGRVSVARDLGSTSYGKYMVIQHAGGVYSLYAHLESIAKSLGSLVTTGATIGRSGHTGGVRSSTGGTGAHLHFEIRPGADTLEELRKRGVRLAKGGVALSTPGGVLSVIAEAGKHERVEPLDRDGMSKRDRVMLEKIAEATANRGEGDTFKVYPAPGMDEVALAEAVSRRVAWRKRRGT